MDLELLRDTFKYEDGKLYRKLKGGRWKQVKTDVANTAEGYVAVGFNKKVVKVHRVIYALVHGGIEDTLDIDHIDGNKQNNAPDNLRLVSTRDNCLNQQAHRAGKVPGVCYNAKINRYVVRMNISNKLKHCGSFTTQDEAQEWYWQVLARVSAGETDIKTPHAIKKLQGANTCASH